MKTAAARSARPWKSITLGKNSPAVTEPTLAWHAEAPRRRREINYTRAARRSGSLRGLIVTSVSLAACNSSSIRARAKADCRFCMWVNSVFQWQLDPPSVCYACLRLNTDQSAISSGTEPFPKLWSEKLSEKSQNWSELTRKSIGRGSDLVRAKTFSWSSSTAKPECQRRRALVFSSTVHSIENTSRSSTRLCFALLLVALSRDARWSWLTQAKYALRISIGWLISVITASTTFRGPKSETNRISCLDSICHWNWEFSSAPNEAADLRHPRLNVMH